MKKQKASIALEIFFIVLCCGFVFVLYTLLIPKEQYSESPAPTHLLRDDGLYSIVVLDIPMLCGMESDGWFVCRQPEYQGPK